MRYTAVHNRTTFGGGMNLDWDDLRVFLAIAQAGSLRRAAEVLLINHATAHRALQRLENELGTRLFDRSPSGLSLTQAGELLLPHADVMEKQTFELARKIAGVDLEPGGIVRVSLPPALAQNFFMPIAARFAEKYPDIEIKIELTNSISDLSRQEADVSIRIAHEVSDNVVGRRLVRYLKGVYASPDYLASLGSLEVGKGNGATWVGWGTSDEPDWVKSSPFPSAGLRHAFPEAHAQIEAAAAGLGLIWMSCFLADPDPRLVRVPGVTPQPDRSIWLLLHSDLRKTARVRAFVDFVSAEITRQMKRFTT